PPWAARQRRALVTGGVGDDDRLPPAEVDPGGRGLVAHAPGQAQHVPHGVLRGGGGVDAGPAQRRTERGGVDGDDRAQPGTMVVAMDELFEFFAHHLDRSHLASTLPQAVGRPPTRGCTPPLPILRVRCCPPAASVTSASTSPWPRSRTDRGRAGPPTWSA